MGKLSSATASSATEHNPAITFVGTVNSASTATALAEKAAASGESVQFVHELPQADEERLERLFRKLDRDGNGRIDIHDLSAALREVGMCHTYAEVRSATATGWFSFIDCFTGCRERERERVCIV